MKTLLGMSVAIGLFASGTAYAAECSNTARTRQTLSFMLDVKRQKSTPREVRDEARGHGGMDEQAHA